MEAVFLRRAKSLDMFWCLTQTGLKVTEEREWPSSGSRARAPRKIFMLPVRPPGINLRDRWDSRHAVVTDQTLILILSDINMPGMSGLELLPKAKAARLQ